VTTIHGDYLACAKSCHGLHHHHRHFFSRSARIDRRINQVVLISEPQREAMRELFPVSCQDGRHRLIINGLSLPDSEQISRRQRESMRSEVGLLGDGLIIGMVARGIADKGWDVLLHAFEIACLPVAELLLIGDGPALRQLSKRFHSPRIHFYGSSSEPHKLMRLCDLTCLPSRYASESCPLAVAESLSVGVPVIATRVGQISWMVDEQTDHPAGITLPPEDPEPLSHALADVLTALYYNRDLLGFWKHNCQHAQLKFSMDRCVQAYLQAYQAASV
jgi:glycosyltransferase involved in cell wall biosynthesis